MVTDSEGYIHIIEYLAENLSIFEKTSARALIPGEDTIMTVIEEELSEQIISVCTQNTKLTFNQRNTVVREVDAVVSDLEEVLSNVVNNPVSEEQINFIHEFALLIKNLFDTEIQEILAAH